MRFVTAVLMGISIIITRPSLGAEKSATEKPDVVKIIQSIESLLSPVNMQGVYEFKNTRLDGTTSIYKTKIASRDPDHAHISFLEPIREKGREVLRQGDELWTFVPSVGRVVKIQDRDSFAGGDFSNADVLRIDWLARYKAELVKESEAQLIVDLKADKSTATYARMRLWIKKANHQPVQQEFYDSKDTLLKRLRYGSVRTFGTLTRPALLIMENVITKQKSELRVLDLSVAKSLPESRFTVESLGK